MLTNVSIMLLPISTMTILFNTHPLFLTVLAAIFLGEPMTIKELFCLMGCFLGVILISQSGSESISMIGLVAVFGASVCQAGTNLTNRMLKDTHFSMVYAVYVFHGCVIWGVYLAVLYYKNPPTHSYSLM